ASIMTTRATRGPRRRTVVALAVVLAVLTGFVIRLVDIQVVSAGEYTTAADRVMTNTTTLTGVRGDIVDADGSVLASSRTVYDYQLSPLVIRELEENERKPPKVPWAQASEQIAEVIGTVTAEELREKVAAKLEEDPNSQYLPIVKGLSTEQYLELRALKLPYLAAKSRSVRVY